MSRYLNARYQAMRAYTPGEQPVVKDLIKLNTNESPFPPAPGVVAAASKEAVEGLRLYSPIGVTALDRAIARRYGVGDDQVLIGNGSDEILSFIFLAYGDMGATFPDITYGFYQVWSELYGVSTRAMALCGDFTIDPADYRANDKMVLIANPNAPTGIALSIDDIESIVRANPDRPVVIDEAYVDFGGQSAVGLLDRYDNLLVVMTCSKSRSLAGGRLGFALGNRAMIEDMNKIRYSVNPYNVNTLTQRMGEASFADEAYFAACTQRVTEARDHTTKALRGLGFTVLRSSANFVFASPPGGDGKAYQALLRERNILVRHFDKPRISPFVRISIGRMDEMAQLINVTKEAFS